MAKKILTLFVIASALAFVLPFNIVGAQSQVKITSVTESISLGTTVTAKGESSPNSAVLLSIKDAAGVFAYSVKTNSDSQGKWVANFDQPLKGGKYLVEAVQQDAGGLSVASAEYGPIEIKGSFAIIVAIFSFLVIILSASFIVGWYISKLAETKRYRRILAAQRDVVASYNVLKNDIDKALADLRGNKDEFLLKRASENLEKMNKYVVKGISIIGKYDIISKIDEKLKFKKVL